MNNSYAVKGNIIYTKELGKYDIIENGYIVVEGKLVKGVYREVDDSFKEMKVIDYNDALIIPGFVDLHTHAPQFANIGLGLDMELMPWLETYTFPEESKYNDMDYAKKVYSTFIKELWKFGTTRACVFATVHKNTTKLLMDLFHKAGLSAFVGKVNMDKNTPNYIQETMEGSIKDTIEFVEDYSNKYELVKPIITPRFVPTCSFELLEKLGALAKKNHIPVQSHLAENYGEIALVKELYPKHKNYSSVYEDAGLFGDTPTIMAHCVLVDDEEIDLMSEKKVYVAHCPNSNSNLSSGIAPVRKLLKKGVPVGLASDVSGGHSLSMMNVIVSSCQVSNLKWIDTNKQEVPLTTAEAFFLATKGGGSFFGKVGSFEKGYEFDALIIDDSTLSRFKSLTIEERLQKFIYTGDYRNIIDRFIAGRKINEPEIN